MMYYKDGTLVRVFCMGVITGAAISGVVAYSLLPQQMIDPRLLRVAEDVCRNNQGPKRIERVRRGDVYDIRCADTALFQNIEAKFDDTPRVAGAQLQEKK
jgi:hypothetical protein